MRWIRIFSHGTAETDQAVAERSGADKDEPGEVQHLHGRVAISGLVHVDHDIGAVERDHDRPGPGAQEREQMHRDVPKIDVEKVGPGLAQEREERALLRLRDLPGRVHDIAEPETPEPVGGRARHERDRAEGKPLRFLAFSGDDHGAEPLERRDLPVDVKHLRLEKRRAITGDDRPFPGDGRWHRTVSQNRW